MNKTYLVTLGVLVAGSVFGGTLPSLQDKPWLGCFAGYEDRSFDFALGTGGESDLFFKEGGDRVSRFLAFKVRYVLEEKINDRWVRRTMAEDGFETSDKATDDPEKMTFTATYTGDTKVEVVHEFEKGEVLIGIKIVEKKTDNPIRCGVVVTIPDIYRGLEEGELSKRDLRKKVDAEVEGETLEGKRLKADLYELPKLGSADYFEGGAKTFTIEAERIAGREVTLSLAEEETGRIDVDQTRPAMHGFSLNWWPDPEKTGAKLLLEVD